MIPVVKKSFERLVTGLKVYGIFKNNLKTVYIPVPPKKEQEEIVEVLEIMPNDIDSVLNQLEKARLIKPEGGQS